MNPELRLEVKAIVEDALRKFKQTEGAIDGVKRKTDKATASSKKFGAGLSKLKMGLLAIGGAIFGAIKAVEGLIKAYGKQEAAEKKLVAALKNRLKSEEEIVTVNERMLQLAKDRQKVTTYADEESLAALALAGTYNVTAEQMEAMLIRAQDFAAATGKDLTSAMVAIGNATQGQIGQLTRYGVTISETTKETGDFNSLMKDLDNNFKGFAETMATTVTGRFQQLKNLIGGASERLGAALLPALESIRPILERLPALMDKIAPALSRLVEAGTDISLTLFELVEELWPILEPILDGLGYILQGINVVLKEFVKWISEAIEGVQDLIKITSKKTPTEEKELLLRKRGLKSMLAPVIFGGAWLTKEERLAAEGELKLVEAQLAGATGAFGKGLKKEGAGVTGLPGITPTIPTPTGEGSKAKEKGEPRWWVELQAEIAATKNQLDRFDEGIKELEDDFAEVDRLIQDTMQRIVENAKAGGELIGNFLAAGFQKGLSGAWDYIKQLANRIITSGLIQLATQLIFMLTGQPLMGGSFLGGVLKGVGASLGFKFPGFDDPTADLNAFRSGRDVMRNVMNGMNMVLQTAQPSLAAATNMAGPIHIHNHLSGGLSVVTGLIKSSSSSDRRGLAREVMVDIDKEDQV